MEFEFRRKGEMNHKVMNENSIFIKMQLDGLSISLNHLIAFLKSDYIQSYNPFYEYFESLPVWDECTDYIQELASYVRVKKAERLIFDNHFTKWIVRMVKCSLVDDYFNKQAFILVQSKQNSGKSTFCRFLCPPRLKNYIAENPSIDKDSRILLTSNMIINLDELSTFSKVEINSLKSLFSKDKINDRLPYDRKNSIIPRRASFIGSTNQMEFLNDESGSVRWLCFLIEEIDWSYKDKVNIDLVYAQAYFLFRTGWPCDLTPEEITANDKHNWQFHTITSENELVERYFEPADRRKFHKFMTTTEILIYISEKTDNRVRLNTTNIGKALRVLGFVKDRKSPEWIYGYFVILKK
jgi:predicted P-loop ATPase